MEKKMSAVSNLLYRFSSRGLYWPAVYGSVFGINVFHFSTFVSAFLGATIGYLLIMPNKNSRHCLISRLEECF